MSTTNSLLLTLVCLLLFSCSDPNYKGDNYVSFDSMDELTHEIIQSFKTKDDKKMLQLIANDALMIDALFATNTAQADQLKARLNSPEGQADLERQKLGKTIRIQGLFTGDLEKVDAKNLQTGGMEVLSKKPYTEGSNATTHKYKMVLHDGNSNYYDYNITVIHWENKYHLIEADGYLKAKQ